MNSARESKKHFGSDTKEMLNRYRVRQQSKQSADFMMETLNELHRKPLAETQQLLDESIITLRSKLIDADPFDLLAMMSFLFLTNVADSRKSFKYDEAELSQAHIEFLQATLLTIPEDQFRFSSVSEDARVQEVVSLLNNVFVAHSIREQRQLQEKEDGELRIELAMHSLRTITQYQRNWGFAEQMKRIQLELLEPLDARLKERFGLQGTTLVKALFGLVSLVEDRLNDHMQKLAYVVQEATRSGIVSRYYEAFENLVETSEEMIALVESLDIPVDTLKSMIIVHSGLLYRSMFTVTEEDIGRLVGSTENQEALIQYIEQSALSPGELSDREPVDFFLSNPVWEAPFIRTGEGGYFIPVVGSLVSFSMNSVERFLSQDPKLSMSYQKRRSKYLEEATKEQFSRIFEPHQIAFGNSWGPPRFPDQGENDLTMCSGHLALIVEAKSSGLPLRDLRGGFRSAKASLEKLAVDSTRQGQRFGSLLLENNDVLEFQTKQGDIYRIDTSQVGSALYYNVSLSLHPLLLARSKVLQAANLIPSDLVLTPMASLAELELIISILGDRLQFLHYVQVRIKMESLENLVADELDLFAYYLQGCPRIDAISDGQTLGMFGGMSKIVDVAYASEESLDSVVWERTRRTSLFTSLIAQLKDNPVVGAQLTAFDLMSVAFSEQRLLTHRMRALERNVWRVSNTQVRRTGEFSVDTWEVSLILILIASRGMSLDEDKAFAEELKVMHEHSSKSTVVILRNYEFETDPVVLYSSHGFWLLRLPASSGHIHCITRPA